MITMTMRLVPVAIVIAVLASLTALGADSLWVYRNWEIVRENAFSDPYYFREGQKHLALIGGVVGTHLLALGICQLVLRNGYARTAAYLFLAGLVAIAVLEVASYWPMISGAWPPKRYIDYATIDFATPRRLAQLAMLLAGMMMLAGWVMLVIAVSRRRITAAPGTV